MVPAAAARVSAVLLLAAVVSGCAARHGSLVDRFVKPGEPTLSFGDPPILPSRDDLQDYSRKLRELQAKAAPRSSLLPTMETRDPALAAALLRLALVETAENHRLVAGAYRSAGISDYAHRHYQRALKLEPCDGAAYEGLARVWRDWGLPGLALGDAHRALHCAPRSASAHNTLGTVLQALGYHRDARMAFDRALRLDSAAVFALNNLCYLSLQERDGARAQQDCERALAIEPAMAAARNNLALAYAIQGDIAQAERRFLDSPDPAEGQYNVGILRMSLRQYPEAAQAFDLAAATRPSLWEAARRAAQARAAAATYREP